MRPELAHRARALRRYANDVAGGLMVKEYLTIPRHFRVADVIAELRRRSDEFRTYGVQYAYVTGRRQRLVGVLRLRDLLLSHPDRLSRDLMQADPVSVRDTAKLDEVHALFESTSFFGIPVVNASGRLVGVVTRAAVEAARAERSDADYLKSQGIVGEEIRSMPMFLRSRRRLSWLSINIVLNIVAASVIAAYQDILAAVIALAVFLPIISDMSGCSGNQAVAVSMRELALGIVRPAEVWRTWRKELALGAVNGSVLGALVGLAAWVWQGNPYLGLVVGAALTLNTVVAVSIGGTVPLLLRRFGVDPALASGPILTTITDMCGFFLLLSIAGLLLPQLATG